MYNYSVAFLALLLSLVANGHDIRQNGHALRTWKIKGGPRELRASFLVEKNDTVYLQAADDRIVQYQSAWLDDDDRAYVDARVWFIEKINSANTQQLPKHSVETNTRKHEHATDHSILFLIVSILITGFALICSAPRRVLLGGFAVSGFALISAGPSRTHTAMTVTDPFWMDSAFTPFKPYVNTFWDSVYFHVESNGIPTTHSMMTGITKWQQQVPIPQCYQGNNSWSIPLNPVLAASPVPVGPQHFLRGAVAMAVNGVPIFNPYTNTGVDAFLDGQLDNWGGHSGRADDYHYHTAPLHLYNHIAPNAPIAFGLDGFAVYGSYEPDGSPASPLDTNHGHFGTNGIYHYHGTTVAPYMIGKMVGQVTEDTTLQIVPQARAYPVRPSLTPLNGAAITGFHPNGANGYTLVYTLSGQTDSIYYHWNNAGQYTYEFYTQGTGVPAVQNYNGFVQCFVSTDIKQPARSEIVIYPNPVINELCIRGASQSTFLTVYDISGTRVRSTTFDGGRILFDAPSGIYYYELRNSQGVFTGKFIKQ